MSAAPDPPTPLEPLAALDRDAFCPGCGYNVRGLAGDPIRCPECGTRYARSELRRPKQPLVMTRLERCQRNLKASADLCALATLPGLLALWVLFTGDDLRFAPLPIGIAPVNTWPVALTSATVWLIGCILFATRCWGLRGWVRALAIYHLTAAPVMLINLLFVVVAATLIGELIGSALGPQAAKVSATLQRVTRGTPLPNAGTAILPAATMLLPAWLAVRLDPLSIVKRIGADRLATLAQQLAERTPGRPPHSDMDAG